MGGKNKKWKLWRSSSGNVASEGSDSSSVTNDAFIAAVATVIRAPPKVFKVVRQEWATIWIQTAFHGHLVSGFSVC